MDMELKKLVSDGLAGQTAFNVWCRVIKDFLDRTNAKAIHETFSRIDEIIRAGDINEVSSGLQGIANLLSNDDEVKAVITLLLLCIACKREPVKELTIVADETIRRISCSERKDSVKCVYAGYILIANMTRYSYAPAYAYHIPTYIPAETLETWFFNEEADVSEANRLFGNINGSRQRKIANCSGVMYTRNILDKIIATGLDPPSSKSAHSKYFQYKYAIECATTIKAFTKFSDAICSQSNFNIMLGQYMSYIRMLGYRNIGTPEICGAVAADGSMLSCNEMFRGAVKLLMILGLPFDQMIWSQALKVATLMYQMHVNGEPTARYVLLMENLDGAHDVLAKSLTKTTGDELIAAISISINERNRHTHFGSVITRYRSLLEVHYIAQADWEIFLTLSMLASQCLFAEHIAHKISLPEAIQRSVTNRWLNINNMLRFSEIGQCVCDWQTKQCQKSNSKVTINHIMSNGTKVWDVNIDHFDDDLCNYMSENIDEKGVKVTIKVLSTICGMAALAMLIMPLIIEYRYETFSAHAIDVSSLATIMLLVFGVVLQIAGTYTDLQWDALTLAQGYAYAKSLKTLEKMISLKGDRKRIVYLTMTNSNVAANMSPNSDYFVAGPKTGSFTASGETTISDLVEGGMIVLCNDQEVLCVDLRGNISSGSVHKNSIKLLSMVHLPSLNVNDYHIPDDSGTRII
ncbi:unnamed protein product [Umbelopsis vinacea]